jgi:abortive infection bacteriophage resistance protein
MDKSYYQKPALTFAAQLAKLEQRGMVIEYRDLALEQLACISYYRLSAYWYPFRQWDKQGNTTNQFNPGTTFS